ncbi:MAG: DNA-directed RNA polymerase subunit alpha [Candidatus Gracilibacteria bacterium]|nr:DNA-directed RNA polymerase subunit alpha [Candidatus Gracilibacteria bacterium]
MHIIQAEIGIPQVVIEKLSDNHVLVTVEPLPQGYGMTLGNALRRVLLSSVPGVAITGIKIDGAKHEYAVIPGVKDSVLDFILNLKGVVFKMHDKEPVSVELKVTGHTGDVTAGMITCPTGVEVLNPDLVITSLDNKKVNLDVQIFLRKGVGYQAIDNTKNTDPDLIITDSIFTPVRKVRFDVVSTRVGQMTNLDKLQLEILSNGSFDASESLKFASDILGSYFGYFNQAGTPADAEFMTTAHDIMAKQQVEEEKAARTEYTPIEILNLSPRTLNALINGGIGSIEQLTHCSDSKIANLRGFGKKAMDEVNDALQKRGLGLLDD